MLAAMLGKAFFLFLVMILSPRDYQLMFTGQGCEVCEGRVSCFLSLLLSIVMIILS